MSAGKYTVEPGRCIMRGGVELVTLHRVTQEPGPVNGYATGCYTTTPCEADDLTHVVVAALNAEPAMRAALAPLIRWVEEFRGEASDPETYARMTADLQDARAALALPQGRVE